MLQLLKGKKPKHIVVSRPKADKPKETAAPSTPVDTRARPEGASASAQVMRVSQLALTVSASHLPFSAAPGTRCRSRTDMAPLRPSNANTCAPPCPAPPTVAFLDGGRPVESP